MGRSLRARLGYILARPAFNSLRVKLDPGRANGGVFLGLTGVVIKSHGGTDAAGFAQAIIQGLTMVRNGILAKIGEDLAVFHPAETPAATAPAPAGAA
jgi:glycerol-3-phosphate acyltransferase PlsX